MQKSIHPQYVESTVICGCGETFKTRSTKEKIHVEICSKCHPYYSGKQKFLDSAGRLEKFNKKFHWGEQKPTDQKPAEQNPTDKK